MIIVFYNANENKIYVSSTSEKTKVFDVNVPTWFNQVPNDDILYVTNGHFFTKQQFGEWIQSNDSCSDETDPLGQSTNRFAGFLGGGGSASPATKTGRKYIHATSNGTIILQDIVNQKYPEGVKLSGKWDFIAVDEIGEEELEDSANFKWAINKKKIEVVDEEYFQQNAHRKKTKVSPTEAALDKILIKDSTPGAALKVQADGGMSTGGDDVAIPIYISG